MGCGLQLADGVKVVQARRLVVFSPQVVAPGDAAVLLVGGQRAPNWSLFHVRVARRGYLPFTHLIFQSMKAIYNTWDL